MKAKDTTKDKIRNTKLQLGDDFGDEEMMEEAIFKAGQEQRARDLYEEVICPMCYRLNPQHATADRGEGCHWCKDKEAWCGKPS